MLSFVNIFFYVVGSFGRGKSVHVNTIKRKNVLASSKEVEDTFIYVLECRDSVFCQINHCK